MSRTATIAVLAATAAVTFTAATPTQAATPESYLHGAVRTMVSVPCAQEDSLNCYWDAHAVGSGTGHNFYSVRVGHKMCTIYVDRAYNRRHGYCTTL